MVINQEPTVELWKQQPSVEGMLKHIERCGRVSYKSEDRITDDSYKEFVNRMLVNHHLSVLEHGSVYLKVPIRAETFYRIDSYKNNPHSKAKINQEPDDWYYYISTNYRVLVEHDWFDDLKYLCEPTKYHEKRFSIHVITDRGVSAEANRHRVNTVTERSTRYCDYSNEKKFNGQVRVMVPPELKDKAQAFQGSEWGIELLKDYCNDVVFGMYNNKSLFDEFDAWMFANLACEFSYRRLRELGWTAQQARRVLPLDLETEMVHTAFKSDWDHFLELRCAPNAHPDMQIVANQIKEIILYE